MGEDCAIIDGLVENDTLPVFPVTFEGVVVSDFRKLELHIKYEPYPLSIPATLDPLDEQSFFFDWRDRIVGELAAGAAGGDNFVVVQVTDGRAFDDLPESGELLLEGGERVLYVSKAGDDTLYLASPLQFGYELGAACQRLPDLRAGLWEAEVETVDSAGGRLTFTDISLKIDARRG